MIRAISFLVRDRAWATCIPELRDLRIEERDEAFDVSYSATVEERYLTEQFPDTYPVYRRSTKMLVPFIF